MTADVELLRYCFGIEVCFQLSIEGLCGRDTVPGRFPLSLLFTLGCRHTIVGHMVDLFFRIEAECGETWLGCELLDDVSRGEVDTA